MLITACPHHALLFLPLVYIYSLVTLLISVRASTHPRTYGFCPISTTDLTMSPTAMNSPEAYKKADRGPGLQAFVIVMTIVTVLSILLRFMSRSLSPRHPGQHHARFWLDDWTALAAVVRFLYFPLISSVLEIFSPISSESMTCII